MLTQEGVAHFWMAMKDGGRMANAFSPGNERRLLLLLALPWAWVRGVLPGVKALGEGQGPSASCRVALGSL